MRIVLTIPRFLALSKDDTILIVENSDAEQPRCDFNDAHNFQSKRIE